MKSTRPTGSQTVVVPVRPATWAATYAPNTGGGDGTSPPSYATYGKHKILTQTP